MNCTILPKIVKLDGAWQLTRLPCLLVCIKFHFFVFHFKQNWQSAYAGFHQFQRSTWTGFWEDIQWVPSGNRWVCLSPTFVTYHRGVASVLLCEVSRESCSVSAQGEPNGELHPFSQKIVHPILAKQLSQFSDVNNAPTTYFIVRNHENTRHNRTKETMPLT